MIIGRRDLLKACGAGALGFLAPECSIKAQTPCGAIGFVPNSPGVPKYIDQVGYPGFASPKMEFIGGVQTACYHIGIAEFSQAAQSAMPGASRMWGYQDMHQTPLPQEGSVLANQGVPVRVTFSVMPSMLASTSHPCPVDKSLADGPSSNPLWARGVFKAFSAHLDGGKVNWTSDGHPLSWFSADPAIYGPYFSPTGEPDALGRPAKASYVFDYPNRQTARFMRFQDRAVGLARLNLYAGLEMAYILRDSAELAMAASGAIPPLLPPSMGGREMIWVIQDRAFQASGALWYPDTYNPAATAQAAGFPTKPDGTAWATIPCPSCVPEMFGDRELINGTIWPRVPVDRARYRFRLLNGSQSRFYRLRLYYAQPDGITPNFNAPGPPFHVFGAGGGFLPSTTVYNRPQKLVLAPGERIDMIIDFSSCNPFDRLILWNDAPAPFPGGAQPSFDDSSICRFDVQNTAAETPAGSPTRVPTALELWPSAFPSLASAGLNATYYYTLDQGFDDYGRRVDLLGTDIVTNRDSSVFGQRFLDPLSGWPMAPEQHSNGDVEVWNILNLTGETNPIHLDLVEFQILSRQAFDVKTYIMNRTLRYLGPPMAPEPCERGFKHTVRANPGQITRIKMRIDAPGYWVGSASPYIWNSQILEHEAHDMVRQFTIV